MNLYVFLKKIGKIYTRKEKYCSRIKTFQTIQNRPAPQGSSGVFVVHGMIFQQLTSALLKNFATIEKRKNLASDCWFLVDERLRSK